MVDEFHAVLFMEKKLTNNGPFMASTSKHSIYTLARPVVQLSKLWFEWQSRELPEAVSTRFMVW
jgi:hypothetical protein